MKWRGGKTGRKMDSGKEVETIYWRVVAGIIGGEGADERKVRRGRWGVVYHEEVNGRQKW